jgi:hypothetical protein
MATGSKRKKRDLAVLPGSEGHLYPHQKPSTGEAESL